MTTLHTLNASAADYSELLKRLLRYAERDDSILLIENGVYNLVNDDAMTAINTAGLTVYYLQNDSLARGIKVNSGNAIDDQGFVELSCNHRKVLSWFP
jgi:tRNA 2-thiouridine synthesizing protein B